MRCLGWLALTLLGLLAATPAAAQADKDIAACQSVDGTKAVAACTRLLQTGKLVDSYYAYVFRGVAHSNSGDQGSAIGDLTKAIELDPRNTRKKNHGALYYRGVARL